MMPFHVSHLIYLEFDMRPLNGLQFAKDVAPITVEKTKSEEIEIDE
jgi:hypothetical protein